MDEHFCERIAMSRKGNSHVMMVSVREEKSDFALQGTQGRMCPVCPVMFGTVEVCAPRSTKKRRKATLLGSAGGRRTGDLGVSVARVFEVVLTWKTRSQRVHHSQEDWITTSNTWRGGVLGEYTLVLDLRERSVKWTLRVAHYRFFETPSNRHEQCVRLVVNHVS